MSADSRIRLGFFLYFLSGLGGDGFWLKMDAECCDEAISKRLQKQRATFFGVVSPVGQLSAWTVRPGV